MVPALVSAGLSDLSAHSSCGPPPRVSTKHRRIFCGTDKVAYGLFWNFWWKLALIEWKFHHSQHIRGCRQQPYAGIRGSIIDRSWRRASHLLQMWFESLPATLKTAQIPDWSQQRVSLRRSKSWPYSGGPSTHPALAWYMKDPDHPFSLLSISPLLLGSGHSGRAIRTLFATNPGCDRNG